MSSLSKLLILAALLLFSDPAWADKKIKRLDDIKEIKEIQSQYPNYKIIIISNGEGNYKKYNIFYDIKENNYAYPNGLRGNVYYLVLPKAELVPFYKPTRELLLTITNIEEWPERN